MSTTLVFIELLAAGTLALIAVSLPLVAILDIDLAKLLGDIKENQVLATVVAIAFAYPLGIVVDGIADKFFGKMGDRYREKYNLKAQHSVFSLFSDKNGSTFAEKYFEYNRIRTRIVRSLAFNSILMLIAGTFYGFKNKTGWDSTQLHIWFFFWILVFVSALWSLQQLQEAWFRMLGVAWKVYPKSEDTPQK